MKYYIVRRLVLMIPIVFFVVSAVFFAFKLIPGDPAAMFAGEQASAEAIARIRHEMGLDRPVLVQYMDYLRKLLRGDLGNSFMTGRSVAMDLKIRFGNTLRLALISTSLSAFLGISMGLISAIKRETFVDYLLTVISLLGISTPIFWLGLLLMYVFSLKLGWLPISGNDSWRHYIMPVVVLSMVSIATILRITRSSVLEVMGEDFVRTARGKGLGERLVIVRHVLRNALIPIVTVIGLQFGYQLGGAIITETIFGWPGMGKLLITAVEQRDIPVVQGCLLVFSTSFVLVNLITDLIYAVVDPKIAYS